MNARDPALLEIGMPATVRSESADLRRQSTRHWSRYARLALRHPGLLLAGLFLFVLLLAAIHPPLLVSGDPLATSARDAFLPPGVGHWLGTDENGRDVLTRLVYGTRKSLIMAFAASMCALVGGIVLGLAAGLGPRWLDAAVMRAVDVLLGFPDLLLALVIITFWGQSAVNAVIAIGISGIPRYARLIRAQAQIVRSSGYVEAASTLGVSRPRIIVRHVLPNAMKSTLLLATISVGGKIGAVAALSFLGFGAPPPAPEWGAMLSVGRDYLANAWWLMAAPALTVIATVLAISGLGRAVMRRREGKTA
ncbi:ABC transporter permease [Xylophilus sp.]|uniref:ABC transporter permease n=1 Tax=Xylophilus sp. TaxID=2653893 RepID=UPI0013BE0A67|nr:ABC transporter permease [Xylophilus sp.]KAF1047550.1 MAG: putative D,D-dipeptide transport system permease protein DdpC [Xylophilus sp.]